MTNHLWVSTEQAKTLNQENIWFKIAGYDFAAAPECLQIVIPKEHFEFALQILQRG